MRRGAFFSCASLAAALALAPSVGRGDGAWVTERVDERGRVVAVEPREHATIAMPRESVVLVPFYSAARSKEHPLVYVNVRYDFADPGDAATLRVGFPELRAKVLAKDYEYQPPQDEPKCGLHTGPLTVDCPPTIDAFAADQDGRALDVKTEPGTGDYARWFVFDVTFAGGGPTHLRNRYVAHLGYAKKQTHLGEATFEYGAEYVLHTGSSWSGGITGTVSVWDGALEERKRFADLRPTRADDVVAPLHLTVPRSFGRPTFGWDYTNGSQFESALPRFEPTLAVQASSSREPQPEAGAAALGDLAAMAVDQDETTAWVDAGPTGGVGEWLQVPVHRAARVRELRLVSGPVGADVARVKAATLACVDLDGRLGVPVEIDRVAVTLADEASQRVVLPRPLAACSALRFTVDALHGSAGAHATVAEIQLPTP